MLEPERVPQIVFHYYNSGIKVVLKGVRSMKTISDLKHKLRSKLRLTDKYAEIQVFGKMSNPKKDQQMMPVDDSDVIKVLIAMGFLMEFFVFVRSSKRCHFSGSDDVFLALKEFRSASSFEKKVLCDSYTDH